MNNYYNYCVNQESGTNGSIVVEGILAAQCLADLRKVEQNEGQSSLPSIQDFYHQCATPATFDHCRTIVMGEYLRMSNQFEISIAQFYAELLNNQESLGVQFEKVLHENLWNLYES